MVIFHSYVKLPEGTTKNSWDPQENYVWPFRKLDQILQRSDSDTYTVRDAFNWVPSLNCADDLADEPCFPSEIKKNNDSAVFDVYEASRKNGTVRRVWATWVFFMNSICACHPCAGAMRDSSLISNFIGWSLSLGESHLDHRNSW